MSARVTGLEKKEASLFMRPLYIGYQKAVGKVGTPLKVQARRPLIAWFGNLFGVVIEKSGKIGKRLHVFVQLRAAQIVECPF